MTGTSGLSDDALVLLSAWFGWGSKTSVSIGGEGAKSILSDRGKAAIDELVANGYATAKPFNRFGRMEYTGTSRCEGMRLSQAKMEELGKWSPTIKNPELRPSDD